MVFFSLSSVKRRIILDVHFVCNSDSRSNEISKRILDAKIIELNQAISNYQKVVALMKELLVLADCHETYIANADQIDGFICQIFDDIKSGNLLLPLNAPPTTKINEV